MSISSNNFVTQTKSIVANDTHHQSFHEHENMILRTLLYHKNKTNVRGVYLINVTHLTIQ